MRTSGNRRNALTGASTLRSTALPTPRSHASLMGRARKPATPTRSQNKCSSTGARQQNSKTQTLTVHHHRERRPLGQKMGKWDSDLFMQTTKETINHDF